MTTKLGHEWHITLCAQVMTMAGSMVGLGHIAIFVSMHSEHTRF